MNDWIDDEKARRDRGINRPLLQSDHWAVNARYPGCTLEYCCDCGGVTGRAGKGEDSLFTDDDEGPYCYDCWVFVLEGRAPDDGEMQAAALSEIDR